MLHSACPATEDEGCIVLIPRLDTVQQVCHAKAREREEGIVIQTVCSIPVQNGLARSGRMCTMHPWSPANLL
jgi:hypothetical protein